MYLNPRYLLATLMHSPGPSFQMSSHPGSCIEIYNCWRYSMFKNKSANARTAATAVFAALFAAWALHPADAQQRKSIRWAVASVDTYGYKVAASVVKIVEEALGGEYTVTVNPYPSTT